MATDEVDYRLRLDDSAAESNCRIALHHEQEDDADHMQSVRDIRMVISPWSTDVDGVRSREIWQA
jgi:hypothetical protein